MDLLGKGKPQLNQTSTTSSRVAPVHGAQETDITLNRSGILLNTRTHLGIKFSVVMTPLASLLLRAARLRYGLTFHKLQCVIRSSDPCTSLKDRSSRIKRMLGVHFCLRQWTLSKSRLSRPVQRLIRLKSLIHRSRSVFGVLLGDMSTTPSRTLVEFTWSQGPLVDSESSLP